MVALALAGAAAFIYFDEPLPIGNSGPEAELLTDKMFEAIGKEAWDSIPLLRFTFMEKHKYIWNKANNSAQISWDEYSVNLNLETQNGAATKGGKALNGESKNDALNKAWKIWCNDSFWLNAPAKARDAGTTRSIIKLEDGSDGLLVQFGAGGVSPGDTFLWKLDETGLPESFQMWVSIIPVGGVKAGWSNYKNVEGAMVATSHKLGPFTLEIDISK